MYNEHRSHPLRTVLALAVLVLLTAPRCFGQIFQEDFSNTSQFSVVQGTLGSDGSDDYFRIDDGSNINKAYDGVTGSFLAAQDTDDSNINGGAAPVQIEWTGIDISSLSNPTFTGRFGSVLDGSGDVDDDDFIRVEYSVDGGSYQDLIAFQNDGSSSNTTFLEDTDFDGVGDGTTISTTAGTMKSFREGLPTGGTLDLRLTAHVDAGDEDFAVDDFQVKEASNPTVEFTSSGLSASENDGSVTLTVELQSATGTQVDADVAFQSGSSTASPSDVDNYNTQTVSFSSSASNGDTKTVTVNLTNDSEQEGRETAEFALTNVSGGDAIGGSFTLTIVDTEVMINEVLADPPTGPSGDANEDGTRDADEDEFVEIYNNGDSQLDLGGFTLSTGGSKQHDFPGSTVLDPGEAVVVFGGGTPANTLPGIVQTASSGGLSLTNGGDDVTVRNTSGDLYLAFSYGGEGADDQSLTRDPDFTGDFVKHSNATGANGAIFSPGEKVSGDPLPVELVFLKAVSVEGGVRLTWRTASETNNAGFAVERTEGEGPDSWTQVGYVASSAASGTTTEPQSYSYLVEALPVGTHQFRLRQVDVGGGAAIVDSVRVDVGMQTALKLNGPVPNPASAGTTLSFAVNDRAKTTIQLYNALGQRVRTIYRGTPTAEDEQTVRVETSGLASGIYFVRLEAGGRMQTEQLTIVR